MNKGTLLDENNYLSSENMFPLQILLDRENTNRNLAYKSEITLPSTQDSLFSAIKQNRQAVLTAANKLTRKQREVFDFLIQGKSIQEVADDLGVTRQAVDKRYQNIKKRIMAE